MRAFNKPSRSDFYSAQLAGFQQTVSVGDARGTAYTFPGIGNCEEDVDSWLAHTGQTLATSVEDHNGNIVRFSTPSSCNGAFTETDTLGRTVLSVSGFGASGNTVAVSGLSQPYTITWGTTTASPALNSILRYQDGYCYNTIGNVSGSSLGMTAIALPNGQKYQFSYDAASGLLSKITYPTGGYVSYSWAVNSQSEFADMADTNGNSQVCPYTYDTYVVAHRYVSFDGSTIALQQDFSYTTTWNPNDYSAWTQKTTTVTTHDLIRGTAYTTTYVYSPMNAPDVPDIYNNYATQIPMEQTVTYYKDTNTGGTPLKTVNKTWQDMYLLSSEQTTLDNGLTSKETFQYAGLGQIAEKDDYDFGTSPVLMRKTHTNYQALAGSDLLP